MRLTNAATYGIASAAYLASAPAGEVVSNMTICNAYEMPDRFVAQVMRLLVSAGVVKSVRGVQGGYKLAKPANKISLLEIVEAIDGPIGANGDLDLTGMSKDSAATVEKALAAIEADARKRLAAVTIADLRAAKAA
jgi:Rrf2 family iron-sulfur cluster assembly transcriptional regulator